MWPEHSQQREKKLETEEGTSRLGVDRQAGVGLSPESSREPWWVAEQGKIVA
jgi:hypothetical protein